ncbi:MAG: molybdate transport system ATP-binding protein [Flavobacteriaceae bacterium]
MLKIDLHKKFKSRRRSVDISLKTEVESNKITAFYGKSGVGKSSVLRLIAGLEKPDQGEVTFNDQTWFSSGKKIDLAVAKRKLGFVFQEYNLFPTMTVERNLQYASTHGQVPQSVIEMISMLEVNDLMSSYPYELSGGQKQRIAILRALCQQPDALLLDEPFSALDDDTISELIKVIQTIVKVKPIMILVVSHRKDIIFEMADTVIHLKGNGEFQKGIPTDVLSRGL